MYETYVKHVIFNMCLTCVVLNMCLTHVFNILPVYMSTDPHVQSVYFQCIQFIHFIHLFCKPWPRSAYAYHYST